MKPAEDPSLTATFSAAALAAFGPVCLIASSSVLRFLPCHKLKCCHSGLHHQNTAMQNNSLHLQEAESPSKSSHGKRLPNWGFLHHTSGQYKACRHMGGLPVKGVLPGHWKIGSWHFAGCGKCVLNCVSVNFWHFTGCRSCTTRQHQV
jgi:hypothetical protein